MSRDVLRTYNDAMSKIKRRFLDFGRKKGISDARSDLKILFKQLKDELDTDYSALIAAGLAELEHSQNELRMSALWFARAADTLAPHFKDETERLIAMEYYEQAFKNLKSAKSEQVAAVLLVNTAEKLKMGESQQYMNQFMHDPDLLRKSRHQITKYLTDAVSLRNDKLAVSLLIQATCYMSDFYDAKTYIQQAKKLNNSKDVQILDLLFDIKHCDKKIPEEINWETIELDEFENLVESINVVRSVPDNEHDLIQLLTELSEHIESKYILCLLTDILLNLFNKIVD